MFPELINNGFSPLVRTELYFAIGIEGGTFTQYAVYMRHGSPACGDWYRSAIPVKRCPTLQEAQELLDRMSGVIDAHKHFPTFTDPFFRR